MFVNAFTMFLVGGPFYEAYLHSDYLGKMIFLSLLATSIFSWTILIQKIYVTWKVKNHASFFLQIFEKCKKNPLNIDGEIQFKKNHPNPLYDLYATIKKMTIDILNKNRAFGDANNDSSYLSFSDVESISSQLGSLIDMQTKTLEKNLFILSTIVGLSPLLGILGTVWGILTFFSDLQSHTVGGSNHLVLGGISLALTTTVLGILNAIPALIAYNYLKNSIRDFATEMEGFSTEMLSSIELQYRKVEIHR